MMGSIRRIADSLYAIARVLEAINERQQRDLKSAQDRIALLEHALTASRVANEEVKQRLASALSKFGSENDA